MTGQTKSRYGFGNAQNWLDDEPAPAPAVIDPEGDRETFKQKVQEAAASVGYVAPSEQPKPEKVVPIASRPKKAAIAKAKVELDKGKGRPKGDRTIQMSVRIRQEHDDLIKAIAQDDFSVASIVEAAMVAFARTLVQDKKYKRMPLDSETLALAKSIADTGR
jgi:hypothetical protein